MKQPLTWFHTTLGEPKLCYSYKPVIYDFTKNLKFGKQGESAVHLLVSPGEIRMNE